MTFEQAARFAMPFGKHRGVPLDGILAADPSYLTFIKNKMQLRDGPFKIAFDVFMASKDVQEKIQTRAMDEKHARQNWR